MDKDAPGPREGTFAYGLESCLEGSCGDKLEVEDPARPAIPPLEPSAFPGPPLGLKPHAVGGPCLADVFDLGQLRSKSSAKRSSLLTGPLDGERGSAGCSLGGEDVDGGEAPSVG